MQVVSSVVVEKCNVDVDVDVVRKCCSWMRIYLFQKVCGIRFTIFQLYKDVG
jgi:hypothetical protein